VLWRFVLPAVALAWIGRGFVSSNDGSHTALARALALRFETTIDPDVALTLWIDRAERDGHHYSDRPPGTAFASLPLVRLGAWLDPGFRERALADGEMFVTPSTERYATTYVVRARKNGRAPALVQLQGTALAIRLQAAIVGVLGLLCLNAWLHTLGHPRVARRIAIVVLVGATLWGPYSTVLFSHVTSGALWCAMALLFARAPAMGDKAWLLAGVCGGWAIASDYTLVVPIAIHAALVVPRRAWWRLLAGATPLGIATAAYHSAAFGAWWSVGYDHHATFAFARERGSTFGGDPATGLWTLVGLGRGAGILAQSPVTALAIAGVVAARRWREGVPVLVWMLLLAFHRTPEGGATEDHRYLVPCLPLLAVGFADAWQRWCAPRYRMRGVVIAICGLVALCSAALVWVHFFAWRDG
jgi:hypothetical protein